MKDISPNNVLVLGHYKYNKVKKELKMHRHKNMIEICFLEKGTQYYRIEAENYTLKGGDVLITKPSLLHGTNGYPEEKGNLYWIIIEIPGKNDNILNLSVFESEHLIERLLNIEKPCFRGTYYMKTILNQIFKEYEKKDDVLWKITIINLVLEFLLKVIYYGEKEYRIEISETIKSVCQYIHKQILNEIRLEELADMSNLSLSRFKHRFKEETGIPPAEYIVKHKIEKSKELIATTNSPIQDVAYDLGFSSPLYFSTVFRKYIGVSPTEYRKQMMV